MYIAWARRVNYFPPNSGDFRRVRHVDERVPDAEALRDQLAEPPDPARLGRVVTAGEEVHAVLARLAHHRLAGLAGDERIEAERTASWIAKPPPPVTIPTLEIRSGPESKTSGSCGRPPRLAAELGDRDRLSVARPITPIWEPFASPKGRGSGSRPSASRSRALFPISG